MKPIVREHIQQLDVSLGGGIVSEKIRVDTIDNPILIIGLGGTGIDALLRLKYQINRRFKLPEDPLSKKKMNKIAASVIRGSGLTRSMNSSCSPIRRLEACCRIAVYWSLISRIGSPLS